MGSSNNTYIPVTGICWKIMPKVTTGPINSRPIRYTIYTSLDSMQWRKPSKTMDEYELVLSYTSIMGDWDRFTELAKYYAFECGIAHRFIIYVCIQNSRMDIIMLPVSPCTVYYRYHKGSISYEELIAAILLTKDVNEWNGFLTANMKKELIESRDWNLIKERGSQKLPR